MPTRRTAPAPWRVEIAPDGQVCVYDADGVCVAVFCADPEGRKKGARAEGWVHPEEGVANARMVVKLVNGRRT